MSGHLSIRGLGLNRGGRWLFRNLDYEIPRGSFTAIIGPSGAGKSSFLGCLAGLSTPDEGKCLYHCLDQCVGCTQGTAHAPVEWQRRIGIVFQDYRLIANNSPLSNVLCGRLGRYPWWRTFTGFSRQDRRAAMNLMENLGLAGCHRARTRQLSGGEQQRVAMARALFQEADLLLADEPVSNLDEALSLRVLERLRTEAREHQRTVLCVLHDPELVRRFADQVLHIGLDDHGRSRSSLPHGQN